MDPKVSLREEHGTIMKMLVVLQRFLAKPVDSKNGEGEARDLNAIIEFFEIYVDGYHHKKEEQHVFSQLSRAGNPDIDPLINSLLDEHRQARDDMQQLKSMLSAIQSGGLDDSRELNDTAQHYLELVRKHIRKENSLLLPLIEESLSEIERLQMGQRCREFEEETLGTTGTKTFQASVHALYQKYATLLK